MGYLERNLAPGETLAYRTGCHWIVLFWPLVGGLVLSFFGFALFAGEWMANQNGGRYEGAMVWGGLALLFAASLIGGGITRWLATEVGVSKKGCSLGRGCSRVEASKCYFQKWKASGWNSLYLAGFSATGR
jgi:hypothetical protein